MEEPRDAAYELRTFAQLIQRHNDGDDLADVDEDMRRCIQRISENIEKYGGKHTAS